MITRFYHFLLKLFKKKHTPSQDTSSILDSIDQLKIVLLAEMSQMKNDIQDIKINMDLLEQRFQFKDLKDKQQWGHLQYKLQEMRPLPNEQEQLKRKLDQGFSKNTKKVV